MARPTSFSGCSFGSLHEEFLSLLPRFELHGRVHFRDVRSAELREELVAEVVALCWRWYARLTAQGKDPRAFPSALATYAARAVRGGRRLCGQERARDVMSPLAQARRGFAVGPLPNVRGSSGGPLEEALRENMVSPVPEQVVFRVDFPTWRATRSERDRSVIDDLMAGERTGDVASKYALSQARISQLRRELHGDWTRFCADPAEG